MGRRKARFWTWPACQKRFGDLEVLSDISFQVDKGEDGLRARSVGLRQVDACCAVSTGSNGRTPVRST